MDRDYELQVARMDRTKLYSTYHGFPTLTSFILSFLQQPYRESIFFVFSSSFVV